MTDTMHDPFVDACKVCNELSGFCDCPEPVRAAAERTGRADPLPGAATEDGEGAISRNAASSPSSWHLREAVELPPGSRAELVSLASVRPERVEWLWPDRLPAGKLVTLDGDPAMGKSTLALTLAAHVSTGRPWPDGSRCPAGSVVILSAEDGMADTIRPRLDAAGGDPARVHCLTAVRSVAEGGEATTRPPTLADVAQIREAIERTRARLLVVDVLMAYLPSKTDSHRDQDVRAVLHRIAELADATGCTVLLLRHLNKSGAGTPMYRGGGSIGIVGAARAGYVVAPDPDDDTGATCVLACVKSNLAAQPPSLTYRLESAPGSDVARVVWGEASQHSAADLLRGSDPADDRAGRRELDMWLLDFIREHGGRAAARDIYSEGQRDGYSRDQLKRAKARLHIEASKGGMSKGWDWLLPTEGSDEGSEERSKKEPLPSHPSVLPSAVDATTEEGS
ncbi:MAG: AAA family ATPase [Pseudonocardiaceae bacterium]